MKKALAFLMSVALLVAPAGCAAEPGQLTLERVEQLAEKGEALTWSDFEGYAYEEAGSGLYIRVYDVNEEYYVMVGGLAVVGGIIAAAVLYRRRPGGKK